jgi:riboflavin kinase/FMN adenylyltransferase
MRVFEWSRFMAPSGGIGGERTALTIGVFDGVHRGHQALIGRIVREAPGCIPTVVTFKQNPKQVLRPGDYRGDIVSFRRKMLIFEELGVKLVILIDFSANFSKLSGREFIDALRDRGNPGYAAIGSNFHCGHDLDTDALYIKEINERAGIRTEVVSPVLAGDLPISSSRIRAAISRGEIDTAAALLGRRVELDLAGLASRPREGGLFYDTRPHSRIIPPPGRYPALLRGAPGGIEAEVLVEDGGVLVPSPGGAEGLEFL